MEAAATGAAGPLWVAQLDLEKYFNNVSAIATIQALRNEGHEHRVFDLLTTLYQQLTYRNKYPHQVVGPGWRPPRGLPQGDPCSVFLSNWAMRSLLLAAGLHAKNIKIGDSYYQSAFVYLDDITLCSTTKEDLCQQLCQLARIMTQVGLRINFEKSMWTVVGTESVDTHLHINNKLLPYSDTVTILGVDISATGEHRHPAKVSHRVQQAEQRLRRIAQLPVGESLRSRLAASSATSALNYLPFGAWPKLNDNWLRRLACSLRRCLPAQWAAETAKEIQWWVLHPGHLLWAPWARWYHLTVLIVEHLQQTTERMHVRIQEVRQTMPGDGLLVSFLRLSDELNIQITDDLIAFSNDMSYPLLQKEKDKKRWTHDLRHFLRLVHFRRLAHRRPREFDGVGHGIDRKATVALIDQHEAAGRLAMSTFHRRWITGSLKCRRRFVEHGHVRGPFYCRHCHCPDDLTHILHDCPKWAPWRQWDHHAVHSYPQCLRVCGVVPSPWHGDKSALKTFLTLAPKLLLQYAQWVQTTTDAAWEWGPDGPPPPLPAVPRHQSEATHWKALVKRRITTKQPRPMAFTEKAWITMGTHRVCVSGTQRHDRGVPVFLKCQQCGKRRTHSRRSWFALHECRPRARCKQQEPRGGRWKAALQPYLTEWTLTWSHSRPVLHCMTCQGTVKPRSIAHLPMLLAKHCC